MLLPIPLKHNIILEYYADGPWKWIKSYEGTHILHMCMLRRIALPFRLHAVHGNKWEEIGRHMELSGRAVYDRFRMINNRQSQGRV